MSTAESTAAESTDPDTDLNTDTTTDTAAEPATRTDTAVLPTRGRRTGVIEYLLWCVPGMALTLLTTGFVPGLSPTALSWLLGAGNIQCLANMGFSQFTQYCTEVGAPAGSPLLSGLPQTFVAAWLTELPLIDAWRAYLLVGILSIVGSYAAGVAVLRRFGAPVWLASVGAFVYLTSPSVLMLNGYVYTFHGFVMVPAATWATFRSLDGFRAGRKVQPILLAFLTAWIMAFTDGYAFIATVVLILGVGVAWLFGEASVKDKVWGAATWAAAIGSGALAYLVYVPAGGTHPHVGLGAFRFYGADFISFLIPSPVNYWAADMPWKLTLQDLWGTSDNQLGNYIGWVSFGLFITVIALGALRRGRPFRGEVIALTVVGIAAAFLSLGPSLKFANWETGPIQGDDLPANLTRFTLPTAFLYEHVPGFQDMRATYRSFLITRWVLVVLAVIALVLILRTRAKALVPILAFLLVLDSMPNFAAQVKNRDWSRQQIDELRTHFGPDLQNLLHPGDRALLLPAGNDFLASAFVPFTGATAYNVGIDKNYEISRSQWPASVARTAAAYGTDAFVDRACSLLHSDANVIVLSYVDLREGAINAPTLPAPKPALVQRAQAVATTGRFAVTETGTGIAIRIDAAKDCTG